MNATCARCGASAELPANPADRERVVGEPNGWGVITLYPPGAAVRSRRYCGECFTLLTRSMLAGEPLAARS